MNPLVKILLFLLALPFLLIFFFGLVLPLAVILLVFFLLIPVFRPFTVFRYSSGSGQRRCEPEAQPDDGVLDVECTVVETGEDEPERPAETGQLPGPEEKAEEKPGS